MHISYCLVMVGTCAELRLLFPQPKKPVAVAPQVPAPGGVAEALVLSGDFVMRTGVKDFGVPLVSLDRLDILDSDSLGI
jgi:hypothetical protein